MNYNIGDYKWGEPVLGEPSGTIFWSENILDGLNYIGENSALYTNTLASAFDAWEEVAAIDFEYTSNYSAADVQVLTGDTNGAAGTAQYGPVSSGLNELTTGTITFSDALTWSAFGGGGGTDFYAVALHEVGHILGMGHVNDDSEIMNPTVIADFLGDGDIEGARLLYGTGDGTTPTPDPPEGEEETPPSEPDVTEDDGGGSGPIGLIVGLIAALLAMLFGGGGGAAVAFAAGHVPDDDPDDDFTDETDGTLLSDLLPFIEVDEVVCDHTHGHDEEEDELLLL